MSGHQVFKFSLKDAKKAQTYPWGQSLSPLVSILSRNFGPMAFHLRTGCTSLVQIRLRLHSPHWREPSSANKYNVWRGVQGAHCSALKINYVWTAFSQFKKFCSWQGLVMNMKIFQMWAGSKFDISSSILHGKQHLHAWTCYIIDILGCASKMAKWHCLHWLWVSLIMYRAMWNTFLSPI